MKGAKAKKVSAATEVRDRKAETKKRLLSVKEQKPKKRQAKPKTKKDPNQPKRPPTAFFVYLLVKLVVTNGKK